MRKYLVYETDKLLVCESIAQFGECRRESAVVPFMRGFVCYMENMPKLVAFDLIVSPDCAHVTQFISQSDHLGVMRSRRKAIYSKLLTCMPSLRFIRTAGEDLSVKLVTLGMDEVCYTFAERLAQLLKSNVCIFDCVMQCRGSQQFLVGRHGSDDLHRLHGMHDIRKSFPATLGVMMRLNGKDDCFI